MKASFTSEVFNIKDEVFQADLHRLSIKAHKVDNGSSQYDMYKFCGSDRSLRIINSRWFNNGELVSNISMGKEIMTKEIKAKINTQSNYRNLNGAWLKVVKFEGTSLSCKFIDEEGLERTTSFNLNEIESIYDFN